MKSTNIWTILIVSVIVAFFLGIYWQKRNVWTGFYYPNIDKISDQRTWLTSPPLKSLDECQDWVNSVHSQNDNYDYTCSQGCRYTKEFLGETILCRNKVK